MVVSAIVPFADTVWRIVPRLAVPNGGAAPDDPAQAHPAIATPVTTTAALAISRRLVSVRRIAITATTTPSAPSRASGHAASTNESQPQECERALWVTCKFDVSGRTQRARKGDTPSMGARHAGMVSG